MSDKGCPATNLELTQCVTCVIERMLEPPDSSCVFVIHVIKGLFTSTECMKTAELYCSSGVGGGFMALP